MKALVILNASAGKGDTGAAVRKALAARLGASDYEVHETQKGEDPGAVVRERLRDGVDTVVAAGGDGTVSAIVDALHGSSIRLGIIPVGTGNLIARELNIPTDIDKAVELIAGSPRAMKMDAMKIGDRHYVLNAGVGASAEVIANTTRGDKKRFGRLAYHVTAFRIFRFRPRPMDITVDGTTQSYRAVEVSISNCGILAKALYPKGPDIRSDDGHVDIWILGMKTFWDYVGYVVGSIFGRPAKAEFFTAEKNVVIKSRVPLTTQADGDVIGTTPLTLEVLPGALTVLVPATPTV